MQDLPVSLNVRRGAQGLRTLCQDHTQRRAFVHALIDLSSDPDPAAKVVLGVRADFYARCAEYPELVAAMEDRQVLVGPMSAADLREAIEGPAARAGLTLEPGLVQTVLADLGDEPGSLPLLSHAMFVTWQRRGSGTLTVGAYQAAGGVRQAIAQTADAVYGELSPSQRGIAQAVFLRLTALGEGTEDTRRRAGRAELLDGKDAGGVELVLDRLAQAHGLATRGPGAVAGASGQRLASAGEDATVRVWDLEGGADPVILSGHQVTVASVAFSPDGRHLATGGQDDTVRVRECEACGPIEDVLALAEQRVTRELTPAERTTFLHEPTDP